MNRPVPIQVMWQDGVFVPSDRQMDYCRKEFGEGEVITFERNEERSAATHRHQFAWLREAWLNLPEDIAKHHASPEALRKWALIETGFYHEELSVWDSEKDAITAASFMRRFDQYSVVNVKGNVVQRLTAMSQSTRAMGKDKFQASKQAILELISGLLEVAPEQLRESESA